MSRKRRGGADSEEEDEEDNGFALGLDPRLLYTNEDEGHVEEEEDIDEIAKNTRPGYVVLERVAIHSLAATFCILYGKVTQGISASPIYTKNKGPSFDF